MPDRLSVITQLGAIATSAAQCGDDRTVDVIRDAIELLVKDMALADKDERRRASDRSRKPAKNPRIPRKTVESAESGSAPSVFPHTPFPTPPDNTTTGERAMQEEFPNDVVTTLAATTLCDRMGPTRWSDVTGFLRRRPKETWPGWLKEILSSITGGGACEDDAARVCRDDATLDRRIGSAKGYRIFLSSAIQERIQAAQPRSSTPARTPGKESWSDAKDRKEREEGERSLVANRWGSVEQRRAKPDGQRWWARMQSDAKSAGKNPVLYAYDRMNEPAEVNRATA